MSAVEQPTTAPDVEPSFRLEITSGGASMLADPVYEVTRALAKVGDRLQHYHETEGTILDVNGNTIGTWSMTPAHWHDWSPWAFTQQSIEVRVCRSCGEREYD